jgi:hypothetical protein
MKTPKECLFTLTILVLVGSLPATAQKLTVNGEAIVGAPGQGNNLLTLTSERSWIFRQYDTGPSAALELYSTAGLKNFLINSTGNVGIGLLIPLEKLHVAGNIKADGPKISLGTSEYFNDAGSFLIECNGTLESTLDNTDFLGTSSRRWNTVYAVNGTINTSDAKAKSDIQDLNYGLKEIMKLHPVSFRWKDRPETGVKLGLLAQEVQKVIGEVVVDHDFVRDEKTGGFQKVPAANLGIFYSDLIPVLIKGMQEQQAVIEEKETRIAALERRLAKLEEMMSQNTPQEVILLDKGQALLKQNAPNPFHQTTVIEYNLPENVRSASLRITDAAGKVLRMVTLENRGWGQVNISAHELAAGTYYYSLIVDGKPVDSRSMVLTK